MTHARKIGQGFYTYKGYTIYKDYDFPESDCMKLVDQSSLMKID